MTIPRKFECMGFTVKVDLESIREPDTDGHYHGRDPRISVSKDLNEQFTSQTFWHEYMHCALTMLGYDELNDNEQFVDQMAQCLYQLEKTRVDRK